MSYLSVISLATAKNYLRVDSDFTVDDADITRMIQSALSFVENYTGHLVYKRNKTYHSGSENFIDVFDYPIHDSLGLNSCLVQKYATKRRYYTNEITLSVGYDLATEVPTILIDTALQIIKVWYYEHEKQTIHNLIPENIKDALFQYKRFIIC